MTAKGPINWRDVFEYGRQLEGVTGSGSGFQVLCQAIIESINTELAKLYDGLADLRKHIDAVAAGDKSDERYHQLAARIEAYAKHVFESRPVAETHLRGTARRCYCGSPIADGDFDCWTCPTCGKTTLVRGC